MKFVVNEMPCKKSNCKLSRPHGLEIDFICDIDRKPCDLHDYDCDECRNLVKMSNPANNVEQTEEKAQKPSKLDCKYLNDDSYEKVEITAYLPKGRWLHTFLSFLKEIERNGSIGHTSVIGMMADGDGDFRPKFEFSRDFVKIKGMFRQECYGGYFNKEKLEKLFDADYFYPELND